MRLTHKQRKKRMKETLESAWEAVDGLPESVREQAMVLPRIPIEIVSCPLGKEVNHGGIMRLAEAFRVQMVTFSREADAAEDFSGHRGAVRWQPHRWLSADEAMAEARNTFRVALTLSESAVDFRRVNYEFPLTLIVGSEMFGVPKHLADQCEACVGIPMYGLMGSLNVATATGIVLQHIVTQYADQTGFRPIREESRRLLNSGR